MLWGIRPVQQQAAYGLAVEVLRKQILLGLLLAGEKMPAERKLSEGMNVSRVTLREALRVLQTEGYISIRRGAHGGAFVADEDSLLRIALARAARDPGMVMRAIEFREANEKVAARYAAGRRTPANLKLMKNALRAIHIADSPGKLRQAENSFHLAVAEASQNYFLARALEDALAAVFLPPPVGSLEAWCKSSERLRQDLLTAIEQRDEPEAEAALEAILDADRARLRSLPKVA